jgi:hypothetical protein
MAIARRQLYKCQTVLKLLLASGPYSTMEVLLEAVFSMWSVPRLYHSTDPNSVQLEYNLSSERVLHKDYNSKCSVGKKKILVLSLKGLVTKTN